MQLSYLPPLSGTMEYFGIWNDGKGKSESDENSEIFFGNEVGGGGGGDLSFIDT